MQHKKDVVCGSSWQQEGVKTIATENVCERNVSIHRKDCRVYGLGVDNIIEVPNHWIKICFTLD